MYRLFWLERNIRIITVKPLDRNGTSSGLNGGRITSPEHTYIVA